MQELIQLVYKLYFKTPSLTAFGNFGKGINKVAAWVMKRLLDNFWIPYLRNTNVMLHSNNSPRIVVSLTSFPARIEQVWISIETLLNQRMKADVIILWLAKEEFEGKILPDTLVRLQKRGLIIKYCDNLKSHKKYFYCFSEFPGSLIITADDDLYYNKDFIFNLVQMHERYPDCIVTNRAHCITFNGEKIMPYRKWIHNAKEPRIPSHLLFQTGGAGTLYPPNSLYELAFDKELMQSLCPFADDIWLKMMALLKGTKIVTNSYYNRDFITVGTTQNEKLVNKNVLSGGNDLQMNAIIDYFKIDFSKYI